MGRERAFALLNLIGLASATAGGLFLFFTLTLKPSSYRLLKTSKGDVAICIDNKLVVAGYGGSLKPSNDACPDMAGNGPTPQIETNHPGFVSWGIVLVIAGFILQVPAATLTVFAAGH